MLYHRILRCDSSQEWVVFIHGAGGSSNVWCRQIRVFNRFYNLLMVDLNGHEASSVSCKPTHRRYTFRSVALDVVEVLDYYMLKSCHFVGLSLGTIIIREIANIDQRYVKSMILAGAVLKLDFKTKILSKIADRLKDHVSCMSLYKFYAYLIMPRSSHKTSRLMFIHDAARITHHEFIKWMALNHNLAKFLKAHVQEFQIPTCYIMGSEDHVFLSQVRSHVETNMEHSRLYVIPGAGHVCNVDKSVDFNMAAILFLKHLSPI